RDRAEGHERRELDVAEPDQGDGEQHRHQDGRPGRAAQAEEAGVPGPPAEGRLPQGRGRRDHGAWGSFFWPLPAAGADGGGTTGPMSPSGATSRSTITGAWSLGPLPLRACRSTHAARTRPDTGALASTRSIRMPRSWWNIPAR